jgi:hypothetical protein
MRDQHADVSVLRCAELAIGSLRTVYAGVATLTIVDNRLPSRTSLASVFQEV